MLLTLFAPNIRTTVSHVRLSGVWKSALTWRRVAGTWKVSEPYIKTSGDWK